MAKQLDCYPSKIPEGETIRVYALYRGGIEQKPHKRDARRTPEETSKLSAVILFGGIVGR